jgi:methyltransferase-like protein
MTTTAGENAYDEVPYPNWTHRDTHPRQLEAIATLFGMCPAPVTDCRVLEIGCASGSNLMPMARDLPGSTFVGFDLSATQIAEARAIAKEAGIGNVRFEHADILGVDDSWGRFDYIVCHGIYSWVPNDVREKILAICNTNLAADGVALVSYNVYPGWHIRGMIRDMMLYHVSRNEDAHAQIAQARAMLDFLHNRTFRRTLLCHDDVALDRNLRADIMREFQFGMTAELRGGQIDLCSDDPVSFNLGGQKISSGEPVVKAAVKQLAGQWPDTMSFGDLHAAALRMLPAGKRKRRSNKDKCAASESEKTLASSLMTFVGAGLVDAWVHPPKPLSPLGAKPVASSLARAQARRGNLISNCRHEQVMLDDTERHLIGLLDGEHDREALIDNLRSAFAGGTMVIKAKGDTLKEVSTCRRL